MPGRLLLCTDLDRTLLPNGPGPETPGARERFARLVAQPQLTLAYVSGRHQALVEQAMADYRLPAPDFVVGDVGTTIYRVGQGHAWTRITTHAEEFAGDWAGNSRDDLQRRLLDLPDLRLQEASKQNDYKLSYYLPLHSDRAALSAVIHHRFEVAGIRAALIWSSDEPLGTGLLDILPEHASKLHAVQALMRMNGFDDATTVFCGDSGNDIEVLASPIPAVLVANAHADVKRLARQLADESGNGAQLYIAQGGFMGMNGNYSAGILEGIAHYHPEIAGWIP